MTRQPTSYYCDYYEGEPQSDCVLVCESELDKFNSKT